jgi:hypothetical protein
MAGGSIKLLDPLINVTLLYLCFQNISIGKNREDEKIERILTLVS